ncbi:hypothetical protein SK128_017185, partial [Halocaridina rubra]
MKNGLSNLRKRLRFRICKAALTPKCRVAHGIPRGTPFENEHPEIYETFHTWRCKRDVSRHLCE